MLFFRIYCIKKMFNKSLVLLSVVLYIIATTDAKYIVVRKIRTCLAINIFVFLNIKSKNFSVDKPPKV